MRLNSSMVWLARITADAIPPMRHGDQKVSNGLLDFIAFIRFGATCHVYFRSVRTLSEADSQAGSSDIKLTAPLLDRLLHHAHATQIREENFPLKEKFKAQQQAEFAKVTHMENR